MKDEKIIVTLLGADKVGIVAELTAALAKYGVNIEDIKQTIKQLDIICEYEKRLNSYPNIDLMYASLFIEL